LGGFALGSVFAVLRRSRVGPAGGLALLLAVLLCVKPAIAGAGRLGFVVGLIADLLSALLLAAADALGWLL
jgi:hypothetical protein